MQACGRVRNGDRGRCEAGLTTLSWLLLVAAVAGLAVIAVTVVSNRVGDTGEQLADTDPRLAAAKISAEEIVADAASAPADRFATWGDWQEHHRRRCAELDVLYRDIGAVIVLNAFLPATGDGPGDPFDAAVARAAHRDLPAAGRPQAACEIG